MKNLFKTLCLALLATTTIFLASCNKEDAEELANKLGNATTGLQDMKITETTNEIVATWSSKVAANTMTIDYKWTFQFDASGICTLYIAETTLPTADLAREAYQEAMRDPEPGTEISLNGKTLVIKRALDGNYTKAQIREILEGMKTGQYNADIFNGNGGGNGGDDNGNGGDDNGGGSSNEGTPQGNACGYLPAGPYATYYWDNDSDDSPYGGLSVVFSLYGSPSEPYYAFTLDISGWDNETEEDVDDGDHYAGTVRFDGTTGIGTVTLIPQSTQGRYVGQSIQINIALTSAENAHVYGTFGTRRFDYNCTLETYEK